MVDPVSLALIALTTGLEILKTVINDMPAEERARAWREWFEFWRGVWERVNR